MAWMLDANLSIENSRDWFMVWMRLLVEAVREGAVSGACDCSDCSAAVWVGSESRFASMVEGAGGVWDSGGNMGALSEGDRSRVSHIWRSACRLS